MDLLILALIAIVIALLVVRPWESDQGYEILTGAALDRANAQAKYLNDLAFLGSCWTMDAGDQYDARVARIVRES